MKIPVPHSFNVFPYPNPKKSKAKKKEKKKQTCMHIEPAPKDSWQFRTCSTSHSFLSLISFVKSRGLVMIWMSNSICDVLVQNIPMELPTRGSANHPLLLLPLASLLMERRFTKVVFLTLMAKLFPRLIRAPAFCSATRLPFPVFI